MVKIGILAIQGGFAEHCIAFQHAERSYTFSGEKFNLDIIEVRSGADITSDLSGIVLPGGESTTIARILNKDDFGQKLKDFVTGKLTDKPPIVWGTCSGLIVLANNIENQKSGGQYHIGGLDVTVSRNFFGRQINSFETSVNLRCDHMFEENSFHGVFIRAPAVVSCDSPQVKTLGTIDVPELSKEPIIVAVQQNNIIGTSFHPELTHDLAWHKHFLQAVLSR